MARKKANVEQRLTLLTQRSDNAINVFRTAAQNLEQASVELTSVRSEAEAEAQRQADLAEQAKVAADQAYQRATAVRSLIGE